jgi:hypothetical protein
VHVDHLHGGELLQHAARRQPRRQRMQAPRHGNVQAIGKEGDEDVGRLLGEAEVIIGGWPFPLDMRARAPRLKWFHQRQAVD